MCNLPRPHAAPAIEGWDNYCKSLAKFFIFLTQPIPSRKKKNKWPTYTGAEEESRAKQININSPPPPSPPRLHWQEWHVSHIMNSVCVKSLISIQSCIIKQQGHDVGVLVSLSGAARCSETIRAGACCDSDPSLARPVTAAQFKKKKKKTLYISDTVWNISQPYHCIHSVHDRSLNRNAHWQKPEARRLPHFFFFLFFFINCTLLSRFTANFCQLQCSLSAKMWVWSFVLRGMMQPSCNTKQIMLLATEVFLVPFFKRISFLYC